jgi:hypothetical protein
MATPDAFETIVATSRRRLSVKDMRPPCKALASMGSTTSFERKRRTTSAETPSTRPPISGTMRIRCGSTPIPVLRL